jgi:hypothetical protein
MKSVLLLVSLSMAPSAFASAMMETITCTSSDQTLTAVISTVNRPDFDLAKYDSREDAKNDGITLQIASTDGSAVVGNIVTYATIAGETSRLTDTGKDGKPCVYGTMTKGTQLAAKVLIAGKKAVLDVFSCDDEVDGPHGGECDWK